MLKSVPAADGRVLYAATDRGSVRAYKLPLTGEMGEVRPVVTASTHPPGLGSSLAAPHHGALLTRLRQMHEGCCHPSTAPCCPASPSTMSAPWQTPQSVEQPCWRASVPRSHQWLMRRPCRRCGLDGQQSRGCGCLQTRPRSSPARQTAPCACWTSRTANSPAAASSASCFHVSLPPAPHLTCIHCCLPS